MHSPIAKPRALRAFSLFEVLLALTIFTIALIGTIDAIAIQIRAEKQAEDLTRATMLAQNIIEEIRQEGKLEEETLSGEFEDENIGFKWNYEMVVSDIQDLYKVTVTINWSDGLAQKDYAIETLLAER